MTLADITLPVGVEWARGHALLFTAALAQRIAEVQEEVGDTRYRLEPRLLTDGRYFVGADLLTECVPDGFLYPAFSLLDASRFDEIEVVPMADALALLPPDPPPV
jgi:hypothetical protein